MRDETHPGAVAFVPQWRDVKELPVSVLNNRMRGQADGETEVGVSDPSPDDHRAPIFLDPSFRIRVTGTRTRLTTIGKEHFAIGDADGSLQSVTDGLLVFRSGPHISARRWESSATPHDVDSRSNHPGKQKNHGDGSHHGDDSLDGESQDEY